jgi:hypothetical protein
MNTYKDTTYDTDVPIPWFGVEYDETSESFKPLDVERFISFRIESDMVYLECWDLAGNKNPKDFEKWNKLLETPFTLEKPNTPGVLYEILFIKIAEQLDQYEENFPKNEDNEDFKEISVADTKEPNTGKGMYFCQEGDCIQLRISYNNQETVWEIFDTADKLTSFTHAMKFAAEQAEK